MIFEIFVKYINYVQICVKHLYLSKTMKTDEINSK